MQNEVIIDGCNVAECVCYQKEVYTVTEIFYNHCLETNKCCGSIDNYNCHFKQLQRAKAELEQSKNYAELLKANRCHHTVLGECSQEHHDNCVGKKQCILDLEQIISGLKAENSNLHITIEKLKADLSQAETSLYAWKAENEKLKLMLSEKYGVFK